MPFVVIASPWTGTGTRANPYRPSVLSAFSVRGFEDVTGSLMGPLGIPAANFVVIRAFVTAAVLAQIDASAAWQDALWWVQGEAGRDGGDAPSAAVRLRLRTWLTDRGLTLADVTDALGDTTGVTRRVLAERLRDWLRNRPKG